MAFQSSIEGLTLHARAFGCLGDIADHGGEQVFAKLPPLDGESEVDAATRDGPRGSAEWLRADALFEELRESRLYDLLGTCVVTPLRFEH